MNESQKCDLDLETSSMCCQQPIVSIGHSKRGDNSVLNFTGILATEATVQVVHQPWDSCYMLCLTKNSAIRRC